MLDVKKYGQFKIIKKIGKTALRLDLLSSIKVHPVVHVEHEARIQHHTVDERQKTRQT